MASRQVARTVTMRSTLHTLTADDCLSLRPLVPPVVDRELRSFLKRQPGVDRAMGRERPDRADEFRRVVRPARARPDP